MAGERRVLTDATRTNPEAVGAALDSHPVSAYRVGVWAGGGRPFNTDTPRPLARIIREPQGRHAARAAPLPARRAFTPFAAARRVPPRAIGTSEGAVAGYIIAHLDVTDPAGFERYRAVVPRVVEQYGGRYLVRGGSVEALEGEWTVPRLVILEFESAERARQFYHSREYQEVLPLRLAASRGVVVVAGSA